MLIQEMAESDCFTALKRAKLGRLACAHDNQPYVVPIYFVFEDPYLYGFTTPGQKVEWMRSNPLVCVELDEVVNRSEWSSILVFGRYEELQEPPGAPEWDQEQRRALNTRQPTTCGPTQSSLLPAQMARLHARELLQAHAEWWETGCDSRTERNPDQPLTPVFYRILIGRITGRRATPSPGVESKKSSPSARDSQGWLRKLFHALPRPFVSR